jgi:hypothetical protein
MSDRTETPGAPRRRPNANYPLSEKKNGDEGLHFHYSREQRLAKAPPSVRALYEEKPKKKFSFFRTLTATRPLSMLFASIMILCAALMIISFFNLAGGRSLGGNTLTLEAVKFRGETVVVLKKTVKNPEGAYTGPVDIGVSPAVSGEDEAAGAPVFTHRIFFSLNAGEEYRFSLPFEADALVFVLMAEQDTAQFKIKVK